MAEIIVKPIDKKSGRLGLEKYKLNRFPGTKFMIEALVNERTGLRDTGLSKEDEVRLGNELGEDLSPKSEFWDTQAGKVALEDKEHKFSTENPKDQLFISLLKANKYVANSEQEFREGKYPDAKYIIYNQESEAKAKLGRIETKRRAYAKLDKMKPELKKWLATVIVNKSFENLNQDTIDVTLGEYIESGDKYVNSFLDIAAIPVERIESLYLIKLGVMKNVLRKSGTLFMRGDKEIGFNEESAIDWMCSPVNQDQKLQIEKEIQSKL